MKQFNTIEININDSEICEWDLHEFFINDEVYYGIDDDIIGWSCVNNKTIIKYFNLSSEFREFLEEIKQDVTWIDKIIIWKYERH